MPMDRRAFLYGTMASLGTALSLLPARSRSAELSPIDGLRGSLSPDDAAVVARSADDRSKTLQKAAERAAAEGRPLFLPPGRFEVSNLHLPPGLTLIGVPGQTRLVYTGGGRLLQVLGGRGITVDGIVFDGANRALADPTGGLVDFTEVEDLAFSRCEIVGSAGHALTLARVSGRVSQSRFSGARGVGVVSTEGRGLDVSDNGVVDCGAGGILVQRWSDDEDGTAVSGNRVERIRSLDGAGGHGHGVEIFRARGVAVASNRIADCTGSAIAIAGTSGAQVTGNQCRRSGATGIQAADASDGALMANNLVDGAVGGLALTGLAADSRLAAITGNMIRNVTVAVTDGDAGGIGIHVDADAAVTGNVVEAAARIGLRLGWGPSLRNVVASANVIRDTAIGIGVSIVEGVGRTVVSANMISAAGGGIRGMRWQEFVTLDLTASDADAYPGLLIERNQVG
jgi:uncharacterized secreted repeat protein (TIGR03808 family)